MSIDYAYNGKIDQPETSYPSSSSLSHAKSKKNCQKDFFKIARSDARGRAFLDVRL